MSIIDHLCKEKSAYIEIAVVNATREIDMYWIDFTKTETEEGRIFSISKKGLSASEAFITLLQRSYLKTANREEPFINTEDNQSTVLHEMIEFYKGTSFLENIAHADPYDQYFLKEILTDKKIQSVYKNNLPLTLQQFFTEIPLLNHSIISVSKTKFERLEVEYYIETENHFLLYNWFTTA